MEKRNSYEKILKGVIFILVIIITVIITLIVTGNLKLVTKATEETNIDNVSSNSKTTTNAFDPYSSYSNIKWSRNTDITGKDNTIKAWIDSDGVVNFKHTGSNNVSKISKLPEKAKYFDIRYSTQSAYNMEIVILTVNNNIYCSDCYIDPEASENISSNDSEVHKIESSYIILDIAFDIDTAEHIYKEFYCLTAEGKLLLLDLGNYKVTDVTYEDNNSYEQLIGDIDCLIAIDSNGYLKSVDNPKNFILFDSKNIKAKYIFINDSPLNYNPICVTSDNKILTITHEDVNKYNVSLYTEKAFSSLSSSKISNSEYKVSINYTDGTTETFSTYEINQF